MKELAVISPTWPASAEPWGATASSKKRSVNGAPSEYFMWQLAYFWR